MDMYDLRYEPWIPVVYKDGSSISCGLYNLLKDAHEIKELELNSPLESISILRMLVGLVQHMFGDIKDEKDWKERFTLYHFDERLLKEYFEESPWKDRFYLFHPVHPFWQIPGLKNIEPKTGEERPVPLVTLDLAEASGNNKTLFSHRLDAHIKSYSSQESARLLVASQFFSLGGLNKKTTNYLGLQKSYYHASLVAGMPTIVDGDSLFETILFNTIPKKFRIVGNTRSIQNLGSPPWAQNPPADFTRLPHASREGNPLNPSFLEMFLPWSRYVRLIPNLSNGSAASIECIAIAQGVVQDVMDEPWTSKGKDLKKQEYHVVSLAPERAVWRDIGALIGAVSQKQNRAYISPQSIRIYNSYRKYYKDLSNWRSVSVMALANDKAKPLLWRKESLNLPMHMVDGKNPQLIQFIKTNLELAEEMGGTIQYTLERFYAEALGEDQGKSRKDSSAVRFASNSYVLRCYWAALETTFTKFIHSLDANPESNEFLMTVFQIAEESIAGFFNQFVKNDIRLFPAQEKARRFLRRSIYKKKQALGLLLQEV